MNETYSLARVHSGAESTHAPLIMRARLSRFPRCIFHAPAGARARMQRVSRISPREIYVYRKKSTHTRLTFLCRTCARARMFMRIGI